MDLILKKFVENEDSSLLKRNIKTGGMPMLKLKELGLALLGYLNRITWAIGVNNLAVTLQP